MRGIYYYFFHLKILIPSAFEFFLISSAIVAYSELVWESLDLADGVIVKEQILIFLVSSPEERTFPGIMIVSPSLVSFSILYKLTEEYFLVGPESMPASVFHFGFFKARAKVVKREGFVFLLACFFAFVLDF